MDETALQRTSAANALAQVGSGRALKWRHVSLMRQISAKRVGIQLSESGTWAESSACKVSAATAMGETGADERGVNSVHGAGGRVARAEAAAESALRAR